MLIPGCGPPDILLGNGGSSSTREVLKCCKYTFMAELMTSSTEQFRCFANASTSEYKESSMVIVVRINEI